MLELIVASDSCNQNVVLVPSIIAWAPFDSVLLEFTVSGYDFEDQRLGRIEKKGPMLVVSISRLVECNVELAYDILERVGQAESNEWDKEMAAGVW